MFGDACGMAPEVKMVPVGEGGETHENKKGAGKMVYETTKPTPLFLSEIFCEISALFPFQKGRCGEMLLEFLASRGSNHPNA